MKKISPPSILKGINKIMCFNLELVTELITSSFFPKNSKNIYAKNNV
ncbi:MAG: hypothetical protein LAT82_01285 [Nanoarchaeota archaeon]|nr:hypothetical protein [Nanoarchaeota archaeon]